MKDEIIKIKVALKIVSQKDPSMHTQKGLMELFHFIWKRGKRDSKKIPTMIRSLIKSMI